MSFQQIVNWFFRPLGLAPEDAEDRPSLPGTPGLPLSLAILTDSYKPTHFRQYPEARKMVAYGEFRKAFDGDTEDERMVVYGIRYIIDTYVSQRWTLADVTIAEKFFSTHNVAKSPYPFPKDLFLKFIHENDGYFPVKIEALPEGTVCYPHTPVYQITATNEYSRLVTYLETLLTMIWYPTTVATLSRRAHTIISEAFEKSVDPAAAFLLDGRLHDFGFRGCTSVEQSVIGGSAHLLNFIGSDTMSAAFYVQFHRNNGNPVAESIPATEHSVMTAFKSEKAAIEHMINEYGGGVFACVMDSYDYTRALSEILPTVATIKTEKGGFMVLRPDSGNPVTVVLQALEAADKIFGSDINSKGYKVPRGVGVIQGDGINLKTLNDILVAVLAAGFSAQSVAFGMGAGLLQKVNRDTMSFATKLSHIVYADGTERNIMKAPKTDSSKFSLPGQLAVKLDSNNIPVVFPAADVPANENILEVVYDNGPVFDSQSTAALSTVTSLRSNKRARKGRQWPSFDILRAKVAREWHSRPRTADPISQQLKELIQKTRAEQQQSTEDSLRSGA